MALKPVSSRNTEIETEKYKFEREGDALEGYLIEKSVFTYDDKDLNRYVVKNDVGAFSFIGTFKLNELLSKIETGTRVQITYRGTEKTKAKRTVKLFEVLADNDDMIEVA